MHCRSSFVRIILKVAATSSLVVALTGLSDASSWRSYHNTRFGPTADVPANWKKGPVPANNDGGQFLSPDGQARITISGIFSGEEHADEIADRLKPNDGETVTESHSDAAHVTIKGWQDATSFVRVSVLSCSGKIWNDLDINFPTQQAGQFAPIVDHVVKSFHPGKGYDMKC